MELVKSKFRSYNEKYVALHVQGKAKINVKIEIDWGIPLLYGAENLSRAHLPMMWYMWVFLFCGGMMIAMLR